MFQYIFFFNILCDVGFSLEREYKYVLCVQAIIAFISLLLTFDNGKTNVKETKENDVYKRK